MKKICVFGLGKMGLPLAAVIAEKGFSVAGVDINPVLIAAVNSGKDAIPEEPGLGALIKSNVSAKRLSATASGAKAVSESDLVIILVPTFIKPKGISFEADLSNVKKVCETIAKGLKKGAIVVTECTMPPGATESLIPLLEKGGLKCGRDFGLAHCPERTMSGTAIRDIAGQYPKIIGASDERTARQLEQFYCKINSKGAIVLPSIKEAECVKVFEGIYRDVNIALGNELAVYCKDKGVDAERIFNAANTQPYCNLHSPGCGVGGHCIPFYPYFVINSKTPLIKAARQTNDQMPYYTVSLLEEELKKAGRSIKGAEILVLGLTFRAEVKEFHKTPAEPIIAKLNELGARVSAFDPMCNKQDAKRFGAAFSYDFRGKDGVILVTDYKQFREINWQAKLKEMRTKIVVDGRSIADPEKVRRAGGVYTGIARS